MRKVKYYYDTETLSYRKIERKKGKTFGLTLLFVLGTLVFSLLFLIIYLNIPGIETPKEKAYKRELSQMKFQYQMMSRQMDEALGVLKNVEERDNNIYRIYFEADAISDEQRKSGFGGVNRYKNLEGFENSIILKNTKKKLDKLKKRIVVQSKSLDEIVEFAKNKEKLLEAIPAIQPISNDDLTRMASGYGYRTDPFTKTRKFHWGMDFTSPRGTPVYATGNGIVTRADNRSSGYGKHIRIDHGYGYVSLYAHLSKYNVNKNQRVKRGELIGFVGSTGRSQAPHLHYEIFKDGQRINPLNYYYGNLSAEDYEAMLSRSSLENQSLD